MASGGHDGDLGVHHNEATVPALPYRPIIKPTLPEAEFGLGISDSTYRPQTWRGMGKLFQQEILCDVMLMAEGQSIPCHKFLLAAASEYFYDRLVLDIESLNSSLLEIEGISFSALKVVVSYLYTGNINITVENEMEVIPACKMLKLTSAYDTCETFALETINPGNCIGLFKMASTLDAQDLAAKSLDMMVSNFTEIVSDREFFNLPENEVAEYMQNENLKIPVEDPVFEAVVSWVRHQPQERESSFSRLITHVRLRYCSPPYLSQVVSKEPLMDNHECQKFLIAALLYQSSAAVQTHQPSGNNDHIAAPRKSYAKETTLVTIGGMSDPGNHTRTDCWRLEDGEWRVMEQCPMPVSLFYFSACMMKEGILVTGGRRGGKPISQCWLLSTSTYQWNPLPDLNTARYKHSSVCVGCQVYVIAGKGGDDEDLSSVEGLPRFSLKWEGLPDLPKALRQVMVANYAECIYVFGGRQGDSKHSQSVFVYGSKSKSWQTLTDMPQISNFGCAVVWKDRIYIVGGLQRSCMCYNPVLAQWSTLSQCRHQHADAPALVWKDRMLVCGGRSSKAKRDNGTAGGTSVIEQYDPETDTWTVSQIELPQRLNAHFVFNIETLILT